MTYFGGFFTCDICHQRKDLWEIVNPMGDQHKCYGCIKLPFPPDSPMSSFAPESPMSIVSPTTPIGSVPEQARRAAKRTASPVPCVRTFSPAPRHRVAPAPCMRYVAPVPEIRPIGELLIRFNKTTYQFSHTNDTVAHMFDILMSVAFNPGVQSAKALAPEQAGIWNTQNGAVGRMIQQLLELKYGAPGSASGGGSVRPHSLQKGTFVSHVSNLPPNLPGVRLVKFSYLYDIPAAPQGKLGLNAHILHMSIPVQGFGGAPRVFVDIATDGTNVFLSVSPIFVH